MSTENTKANHIFTKINTYPCPCLSEKKPLKDAGRLFSIFSLQANPICSFLALSKPRKMASKMASYLDKSKPFIYLSFNIATSDWKQCKTVLNNNDSKHYIMNKLAVFIGSFFVWILMHFLFLSCRKHIFGHRALVKCIRENEGKALSASWHRSMLFTIYYFRKLNAALMTSRSQDGDLLTSVLWFFGYFAPRGSSGIGKGGQEALEVFVEHINKGNIGGLAIDGPKGPPYISKYGIAKAAARTGAPILLHIWYAKSNIRVNSWDRTIIPKPFSEVVMIIDRKPIYVPSNGGKEHLEKYRKMINTRLLHLTYQADQWFKMRDQYPDPRNIPVPRPVPTPYHPAKKIKNSG